MVNRKPYRFVWPFLLMSVLAIHSTLQFGKKPETEPPPSGGEGTSQTDR